MDQIKIGKFIASCRKEQGMTQASLAENLGISDRAVSKWETGKSMPDSGIMLELCDLLKINVNELLSGERIMAEAYDKRAEENLLAMRREVEEKNRQMLIRMNTWIAKKDKWTLAELEERSEYLMGRALTIWAAPVTDYKSEEKQLDTYTLEDEGELTGRLIAKFTFKNTEQPVTSWVEMFQKVIQILYAEDKAIITKLAMSEEENIALHFNTNPDAFTKSLEIGDGIYVWTNTSTQSKLSVLSRLFKLYDEDPADLVFYLRDENEANEDV